MTGPILPGATLGVLGGGQLGAMCTMAARRLGYRVAVWDPDPDAPAHTLANLSFKGPFADHVLLKQFEREVSAVTYEWENIPTAVTEVLEKSLPVRPGSAVLGVLQHRLNQKSFLAERGFPVASFRSIAHPDALTQAAAEIGFPCLCKTATSGYDGKGQWRLSSAEEAMALQHELSRTASPSSQWIVEQFIEFAKELSVLVVRGVDGERCVYPVVENIHEAGILRMTFVPADIPADMARQAQETAAAAIDALNGVGVFCVELFQKRDGSLCINEIAPRPHNSGHYTLDACTVSQFEQQVRALCGLPLGEVRMLSPAAMVNVIGEDMRRVLKEEALMILLKAPGAKLHVYGKRSIRAGRKMGHVTFLAGHLEKARNAAVQFGRLLRASDESQVATTLKK
jgi:5-(carboxyamino)imidazole ribonucleotide synthase